MFETIFKKYYLSLKQYVCCFLLFVTPEDGHWLKCIELSPIKCLIILSTSSKFGSDSPNLEASGSDTLELLALSVPDTNFTISTSLVTAFNLSYLS